jgi:beta-galactosidase/beta-glucuronidase
VEAWEGKVSDIGIRRIEIMMDENAPAINGKRVRVEVVK